MTPKAMLDDNALTLDATVPAIQEALESLRKIAEMEQNLQRMRRNAEDCLEKAYRILATTQARNQSHKSSLHLLRNVKG